MPRSRRRPGWSPAASSDDLGFANTDEHAARTLARRMVAAEALVESVRLAIELTGGVGYTRGSVLERLCRDDHGCQFHTLPAPTRPASPAAPPSATPPLGLTPLGLSSLG